MKKLFGIFLTVLCLSSYSQVTEATTPVYNTIAMSYATMTVYSQVVLSAPEKAGGTFTFSVKAMDGGGRGPPNYPNDVANISMTFYNSSGALIGTAASNNSTVFNTFNTYTVSTADCGGAGCANVYFMRVNMTGNDGGYWAGNAGTNFKEPTLTFTPTGSSTPTAPNLIYNPEFGVPGPFVSNSTPHGWWNSTNAWGGNTHPQVINNSGTVNAGNGGYIMQGGTLSGTVGGYPSTYTGGPTVEGGTITVTNAPSNQIITSGGSSTAGITSTQQSRVDSWTNATKNGNYIYIEQISGNNNTVSVTQSGDKNKVTATLDGAGTNTVNLTQTGQANYMKVDINGYNNSLTASQTNTNTSHYSETSITGNNNTVNHSQSGNTNNLLFTTISGNNNTVTATQSGTGNHYLDTKLTGNGNTALVDQSGSTQNKATIDLTNAGGPATVDLIQTGGKNFSIIQSCVNAAGCTTTVRQ